MNLSEEEWKKKLTPEQYRILRQKGTEKPFTGEYVSHHETGTYRCAACGHELFASQHKFDSGSGWPSFYQPIADQHLREQADPSHDMYRIEVLCPNCGSHLGHLFDDGPAPTGLRYCINSASLTFTKS